MRSVVTAIFLSLASTAAMAQATSTPATSDAPTPAVATSAANTSGNPVPGANSFTEAQAKSHIEAKGYTDVSGLMKDSDGIWRGKGMKGSATHDVALDYQGNVFGQ